MVGIRLAVEDAVVLADRMHGRGEPRTAFAVSPPTARGEPTGSSASAAESGRARPRGRRRSLFRVLALGTFLRMGGKATTEQYG